VLCRGPVLTCAPVQAAYRRRRPSGATRVLTGPPWQESSEGQFDRLFSYYGTISGLGGDSESGRIQPTPDRAPSVVVMACEKQVNGGWAGAGGVAWGSAGEGSLGSATTVHAVLFFRLRRGDQPAGQLGETASGSHWPRPRALPGGIRPDSSGFPCSPIGRDGRGLARPPAASCPPEAPSPPGDPLREMGATRHDGGALAWVGRHKVDKLSDAARYVEGGGITLPRQSGCSSAELREPASRPHGRAGSGPETQKIKISSLTHPLMKAMVAWKV